MITMPGRDSAVSPVVGVMLMLAITVMIAAIVSAAAGGLSGTEKKTPGAILEVTLYSAKDYGGYSMPSMTIKHISGSALPTKDLQVMTYYRTPSGSSVKGNLIGQVAITGNDSCTTAFTADKFSGVFFINDENRFGTGTIQDSDKGYASWFGNASATLRPGDILATPAQLCGVACTNPSMEYLFPGVNFPGDFPSGSVATVKIIHVPSGQLIYDKEVVIV